MNSLGYLVAVCIHLLFPGERGFNFLSMLNSWVGVKFSSVTLSRLMCLHTASCNSGSPCDLVLFINRSEGQAGAG